MDDDERVRGQDYSNPRQKSGPIRARMKIESGNRPRSRGVLVHIETP
jgi:hypothetical protein